MVAFAGFGARKPTQSTHNTFALDSLKFIFRLWRKIATILIVLDAYESSLRDLLVSRGNPNKSKISPSLANGDSFKLPPPLRMGIKGAGKIIQSLRDLLTNSANP